MCTRFRDITTGATGATAVALKFSDALTLFQPWGGRFCPTSQRSQKNFHVVTSLGLLGFEDLSTVVDRHTGLWGFSEAL